MHDYGSVLSEYVARAFICVSTYVCGHLGTVMKFSVDVSDKKGKEREAS